MMRMKRIACTMLILMGMAAVPGCNESAGWADGVSKGVSAAVQALIAAAVAQPIATLFPKPQ